MYDRVRLAPPAPTYDGAVSASSTATLDALSHRLDAAWRHLELRTHIAWPSQRMTLFDRAMHLSLVKHGSDAAYTDEGYDRLVLECANAVYTDLLDRPPDTHEFGMFADQLWHLLGSHGTRPPAAPLLLQALSALGGASPTAANPAVGAVGGGDAPTKRIERLLFASREIGPALARSLVDPLCRLGSATSSATESLCTNDAHEGGAAPPSCATAVAATMAHERMDKKQHAAGARIPGLDCRIRHRCVCPIRGLIELHPKAASLMLLRAIVQVDARYGAMARAYKEPASASLLIRLAYVHPRYFERHDFMSCLFEQLTLPRLVTLCQILVPLDPRALFRLGVGERLAEAVGKLLPAITETVTMPGSPPSTTNKRKRCSERDDDSERLSRAKECAIALRVEILLKRIYHPSAVDFGEERASAMGSAVVV